MDYQPLATAMASLHTVHRDKLYAWVERTTPVRLLLDPDKLNALYHQVVPFCHPDSTDNPEDHDVHTAMHTVLAAVTAHGTGLADNEHLMCAYNAAYRRMAYEQHKEANAMIHKALWARSQARYKALTEEVTVAKPSPEPSSEPVPGTTFCYRGKCFDVRHLLQKLLPDITVTLDSSLQKTNLYRPRKTKRCLKYSRLTSFAGKTVLELIELIREDPTRYFEFYKGRLQVNEGLRDDIVRRVKSTDGSYRIRNAQLRVV